MAPSHGLIGGLPDRGWRIPCEVRVLRRVTALFISTLLLTGCGLFDRGPEEPPEGWVAIDGEWMPPEESPLPQHNGI